MFQLILRDKYSDGSRPSDKGGGGVGGGGSHPDPEIRGGGAGPGLKKKLFSALRASLWSKIRRRQRLE